MTGYQKLLVHPDWYVLLTHLRCHIAIARVWMHKVDYVFSCLTVSLHVQADAPFNKSLSVRSLDIQAPMLF